MGSNEEFDFNEELSGINGWLTQREGNFLYTCARRVNTSSAIVEIGSWKGRSTICLGKGAQQGNLPKVYAVDPHMSALHKMFGQGDTFETFKRNISRTGLENTVVPIRKTSEEAARKFDFSIGLLFIDGGHKIEDVDVDYSAWFDKVEYGGIIAFHDSWLFSGPRKVSSRELWRSSEIKNPILIDTITAFQKTEYNSLFDRVKNKMFLPYRLLAGYFGARKLDSKAEM